MHLDKKWNDQESVNDWISKNVFWRKYIFTRIWWMLLECNNDEARQKINTNCLSSIHIWEKKKRHKIKKKRVYPEENMTNNSPKTIRRVNDKKMFYMATWYFGGPPTLYYFPNAFRHLQIYRDFMLNFQSQYFLQKLQIQKCSSMEKAFIEYALFEN